MRLIPIGLGAVGCLMCAAVAWRAEAGPPAPRPSGGTPVVIELFSSEGCSSCPPAESAVRALDRSQPIAGVDVVALEFHVDYWDYLGWKDPFSMPEFSDRQRDYARALGDHRVYTPEMIVQGRVAIDGGPEDARRHLADAARTELARVELERTSNKTTVRVESTPPASTGDTREVWLAVTESDLASNVESGENRGKELLHGPIVRRLVNVGAVAGSSFVGSVDVPIEPSWKARNVHFVGFVQERTSRRILGARIL